MQRTCERERERPARTSLLLSFSLAHTRERKLKMVGGRGRIDRLDGVGRGVKCVWEGAGWWVGGGEGGYCVEAGGEYSQTFIK